MEQFKLTQAWPDVRPSNAWCLPQTIFVPHMDRVLSMLGLPVESRTNMITAWLPSVSRHKNIVSAQVQCMPKLTAGVSVSEALDCDWEQPLTRRLLTPEQLAPSTALTIIPPPQVLLRVFVSLTQAPIACTAAHVQILFRGVPEGEMKEWQNRGVVHAEMGLDWRTA